MARSTWKNNFTFILATVGAAVGLGNTCRFPGIAFQNGGGAYIIPYIIAMVTVGMPMMAMEMAFGRATGKCAPGAFRSLAKKYEWVGWLAVMTLFCITAYYAVLLGWTLVYFLQSFACPWEHTDASTVFYDNILRASSGPLDFSGTPGLWVIGCTIIAMFAVWLCIRKGISSLGNVVKYTVTVPLFILIIITIRAATLPGADFGLKYLFTPQWEMLKDFKVWAAAYGQAFYCLSLMLSVIITYGSYLPEDAKVADNAVIVTLSNMTVSILSGVAAFGVLGYLSRAENIPITSMHHSGLTLTFITYPTALAKMPGGHGYVTVFSVCFFMMLFALALSTVFSLTYTLAAAAAEKTGKDVRTTSLWICVLLLVFGVFSMINPGYHIMSIVDHFTNDFNLVLAGIAETLVIGWVYGAEKLRQHVNRGCNIRFGKIWNVCVSYIYPAVLMCTCCGFIYENLRHPFGGYPRAAIHIFGWGTVAFSLICSFVFGAVRDGKEAE